MVSALTHQLLNRQVSLSEISTPDLVKSLQEMNEAYRRGEPLIEDVTYDTVYLSELKSREPNHPYLSQPEPDAQYTGERVRHRKLMLSTEKAYDRAGVESFVNTIEKQARALGIDPSDLEVRVTAKLDGIAGYDYGDMILTRGRNGYGTDVTRFLDLGVVCQGPRGSGPGEFVIAQDYFTTNIAEQFEMKHPRNFVSGLMGSETLSPHHIAALAAGVVRFIPYQTMNATVVKLADLSSQFDRLRDDVQQVNYPCDGAVVEITDRRLIEALGHTSHHHRYMIALKKNEEFAEAEVVKVNLFTAKTGRITPVVRIKPVDLQGATVTNVTAHTASHIEELGLGPGAKLLITRSGAVIPKIVSTIQRADHSGVNLASCPCCQGETEWDGRYLVCNNVADCTDQVERQIEFFFKTLNTCRGFGPSICETLVSAGVRDPLTVYKMTAQDLMKSGISPGIAKNLRAELDRSLTEPVAANVFLAAFGIRHLGRGDSARLLKDHSLEHLPMLTHQDLQGISGFGEKTSKPIVDSLRSRWPLIKGLIDQGFNIQHSHQANPSLQPLKGVSVLFTGTMSVNRESMEDAAVSMGATVASSVSKKLSYLVVGEKPGESKVTKATSLSVTILNEAHWNDLVKNALEKVVTPTDAGTQKQEACEDTRDGINTDVEVEQELVEQQLSLF